MPDYPITNATDQADSHPRVHNALSATVNLEAQKLIGTMDPTGSTAVDDIMDAIYALIYDATSKHMGSIRLVFPDGTFRFTRPSFQKQISVQMHGQGQGKTIFKTDFPAGYATISTATYSTGTGLATVTTASPHGLNTGERITVAGVTDYGNRDITPNTVGARMVSDCYNGSFIITKTGASTFTYTPTVPCVYGAGEGGSPGTAVPADAGTGVAGYSLFTFEICMRPEFEGIFFHGNGSKKPVDLIYQNSVVAPTNGIYQNTYLTVIDCMFGSDEFWSNSDWGSETARYGIRCGGRQFGSDMIWIERCHFDSLHNGITMDHNQSIWSLMQHCHFERCVNAIDTASSWHIHVPLMNRITGTEITVRNQARVSVYDWSSENNAGLYFDVRDFQSGLSILGRGHWQMSNAVTRSGGLLGSMPYCRALLKIEGQSVDYSQFSGGRQLIEIRGINGVMYPTETELVGAVSIIDCTGILYSDLDIVAGTDPDGINVLFASNDIFTRAHLDFASPSMPDEQVLQLPGGVGLNGPVISGSFPTPGVAKIVGTFATGDVVDIVSEPAYTPNNISNLKLWFKADTAVYTDLGSTPATNGQAVEQWNDQSGTAHNLTQTVSGARPTLVTNWKNSLPALNFDGVNDSMDTASQALTGATSVTLFVVMDRDHTATSTTQTVLSICGVGFGMLDMRSMVASYDIIDMEVGTGTAVDNAGEVSDLGTGAARNGPFIVMGVIPAGGHSTVYINGVNKGGSSGLAALNLAAMAYNSVGSDSGVASYHKGKIAEVIAYSAALSLADQIKVTHYLARRYAIDVP